MSQIIKPSIGRRVWFYPSVATLTALSMRCNDPEQAMDAGVCYVYHDRMINVSVVDHMGIPHPVHSVTLIQPGDDIPEGRDYCTWMPYQVSQSAKEEAKPQPPQAIDSIEAEIQAKGLTAPRVTLEAIEAEIAGTYYFTGADGVVGWFLKKDVAIAQPDLAALVARQNSHQSLALLTICVLVMHNGFTVVGTSACASPENFNAEIGQKIARNAAIDQIWPLMGYELRSRLHLEHRLAEKHAKAEAQPLAPAFNTEGPDDWGMAAEA